MEIVITISMEYCTISGKSNAFIVIGDNDTTTALHSKGVTWIDQGQARTSGITSNIQSASKRLIIETYLVYLIFAFDVAKELFIRFLLFQIDKRAVERYIMYTPQDHHSSSNPVPKCQNFKPKVQKEPQDTHKTSSNRDHLQACMTIVG